MNVEMTLPALSTQSVSNLAHEETPSAHVTMIVRLSPSIRGVDWRCAVPEEKIAARIKMIARVMRVVLVIVFPLEA